METKSDPEKKTWPLIYFKPFISGLTSTLGDMMLACFSTLRLPAFYLCLLVNRSAMYYVRDLFAL